MNLDKLIDELKAERDRIEQAIVVLERLSCRPPARRGRPPAWLKKQHEENTKTKSQTSQPVAES